MEQSNGEDIESLWDRAYTELKKKDSRMVGEYEELLQRELKTVGFSVRARRPIWLNLRRYRICKTSLRTRADADECRLLSDETDSRMGYADLKKRQAELDAIIQSGLRRMEEHKLKYTIAGYEFVVQDQIAQAAALLQGLKDFVGQAVNACPQASIAWAGVCLVLPLLTNPSAAKQANRDGFTYVTSRMRFYTALEPLLLPRDRSPKSTVSQDLRTEFEGHIVNLYQEILNFQFRSVLRFYRVWLANLGRDITRQEDWEGMLDNVKRLEQTVRNDFKDINDTTLRTELETLTKSADEFLGTMREQLNVSKEQREIAKAQLEEHKLTNKILQHAFGSLQLNSFEMHLDGDIKSENPSAPPTSSNHRGSVFSGTMRYINKYLVDGSESGWNLIDEFSNSDTNTNNTFAGGTFMAEYSEDSTTTLLLTVPSTKGNNRADWVVIAPNSTYYPGKHAGHLIFSSTFPFLPPAVYWDTPLLTPYPRNGEFSGEMPWNLRPRSLLQVVERMAFIVLHSPKDGSGQSDYLPFVVHCLPRVSHGNILSDFLLCVDDDWLRQCTQFFCRAYNRIDDEDVTQGSNVSTRENSQDRVEEITEHHRTISVLAINSFIDHILVRECQLHPPFTIEGLSAEEYFSRAVTIRDWVDSERRWAEMLNEKSDWMVSQDRGGEDRNSYYRM